MKAKKKFIFLLGSIVIASAAVSGTLLYIIQNQNSQKNNLPLGSKKTGLEAVLTKKNLGILENGTNQEILELVQFNNPKLDINEVEVTKINQTLAVITPLIKSEVYEQDLIGVQVTFSIKEKEWLKNVIVESDLGQIVDKNPETILAGLQNANPDLNLEYVSVRLNTITDQTAVLQSVLNGGYKGETLVHYTVAAKKISQDLINPDLGFLTNNDESTIFNALIDANPNLVMSEISLKEISLTSVKLVANESGLVYLANDEALVNFTTSPNSLKDDLTTTDLGQLLNTSLEEITKALKEQTNVNLDEIRIFDIVGLSFKIQAQPDSHYYRVESPLVVNFDLPKKIDLAEKIKFFKLINYRTNDELIQKIKLIIGSKMIEYKRDFTIEGIDENEESPKNGSLTVKSTVNSAYLTGKFEFDLISPVDLSKHNKAQKEPLKDDFQLLLKLKALIRQDLVDQKIQEDTTSVFQTLKIGSTSKKYPAKHLNYFYYRSVDFEIGSNQLFINTVSWSNIPAPIYDTKDIQIAVDTTPMISFVDSTGDVDYPDNPKEKTKYVNRNHNPTRAFWDTTDAVEFGSIYYQRDFNLDKNEFFNAYNVRLNYKFSINAWTNAYESPWKYSDGKYLALRSVSKVFTSSSQTGTAQVNSTKKVYNADGYDHHDGDFGPTYKGAGAVQIFMKIENEQIKIFGVAGSWFDWNWDSHYHHAGYARLKAESLEIVPKKK